MKNKILQLTFFILFFQCPLFSQWDISGISIIPNGHRVWSMEAAPDGSIWVASTLDNFNLPDNVPPVALRSNDGGLTWTETILAQGAGDIATAIAPIDEMTAFVSLNLKGLVKTTDGGQTYNNVDSYGYEYSLLTHFFNEEDGFAMGANATDTVFTYSVTEDGGDSWVHFGGDDWTQPEGFSLFDYVDEENIPLNFTISSLYDTRGNTIVRGTTQGTYLISTDKGYNWERVVTPLQELGYWASSITLTEDNHVMVAGSYNGFNNNPTLTYTTTDGGDTWIEGSPNIENAAIHYIPETDSIFIISGHNNFGAGLYGTAISYNNGADWENIGEQRILSLTFSDRNTGYGACCQNGIWGSAAGQVFKWNFALPTGTSDIISGDYLQIYPNPATDIIQLKVNSLSNLDKGILEIISSTGQVVYQKTQSFETDITQDISDLPKGIYLLRIRADEKSLSKKFIKI